MKKQAVVQILINTFRRAGFDGVSLSDISQATSLGKASLYYHFPQGKDQMAIEALEATHAWIMAELVGVMTSDQPPALRLEKVFKNIDQFYASGRKACLLDVMVTEKTDAALIHLVSATFKALYQGFQTLALDFGHSKTNARVLAEEALVRIQGSLVVSMGVRSNGTFRTQMKILKERFASPD